MRHHNPTTTNLMMGTTKVITKPYSRNYTYTKASPERRYIEVIKYIAEHPGCKRLDVLCAIWGISREWVRSYSHEHFNLSPVRGYMSTLFANLLYDDFIDYNKKYEYTVTKRGRDLLAMAGVEI